MPRVLFIPVSGARGTGEVQRCRILAEAAHSRDARVEPHFLLAPGAPAVGFPVTPLSDSPTRDTRGVRAAIAAQRPDLVVFDGNSRVETQESARRAGARTLLVSSRPSARDRGFRTRRMARLDAHWLVGAELANEPPNWRERLARRLFPRVAVRRFATLFAPPPPGTLERLRARHGLPETYALVCPGGGRHRPGGRDAAELFGLAAADLAGRGVPVVAVGTRAAPPEGSLPPLPNHELMALLAGARLAVVGGGSLVVQVLAVGTPAVALPLTREQGARTRWLARAGALREVLDTAAPALADAALDLYRDDARRAAQGAAAQRLGLVNGLPQAVDELAILVGL